MISIIEKTGLLGEVMQKQLSHCEFKQTQRENKNDIIFVLDNLEYEKNIGSAFRLADAFNIEKIIIISNKFLDFKKLQKTARSCESKVSCTICENEESALKEIEKLKYTPVCVEITTTSKPLREIDFALLDKVALIVGNEKYGISNFLLEKVPLSCHIEMYGQNSSMNVATSLAIVAYKVSEDFLHKNFL